MLTLSSLRRQVPDGVRFELLLTGPSVPERLSTNPIFFELYGTSPHLVLLDGMVQAIFASPANRKGYLRFSLVALVALYPVSSLFQLD
jgi:hypothetical protein